MKGTGIVIIQHGDFPFDFKEKEKKMFDFIERMLEDLSNESRNLRRDATTDPHMYDTMRLADEVRRAGGIKHLEVAYLDFSRPTIEEAVQKLEDNGIKEIIFVNTPGLMMRSSHSLLDIPGNLKDIALRYKGLRFIYAKPGIISSDIPDALIKKINYGLGKPVAKKRVDCVKKYGDIGVILIAHGDVPHDFIRANKGIMKDSEEHVEKWSEMVRNWPRNEDNDPLLYDTMKLVKMIKERGGFDNLEVGNLEFASPSVKEAYEKVISRGAQKVIFLGGTGFFDRSSHTLIDIPETIEKLKMIRPDIELTYVYPDIDLVLGELVSAILAKIDDALRSGEELS